MTIQVEASQAAQPITNDSYLGFEIWREAEGWYWAFPSRWADATLALLDAADLPTLRKRIWMWWHCLAG